MLSEDISKTLKSEGFSQTTIAKVLGCSPSLVSKIINRRAVSTIVAISISKLLERPLSEVFPEYMELAKVHRRDKDAIEQRIRTLLSSTSEKQ